MILQDELVLLRGVPLFAGMNPMKIKLLAFASDRVTFEAGQYLFRQGDAADAAYVILSGSVELILTNDEGVVKVGEAYKQSVVGEFALLCDKPRNTSAIAATKVETLRITKDHFQQLLACCPDTMAAIMTVLGDRMAKAI
ncbi:MAG: cyclic nucleotide-binding domain-containing protein [Paracoccaceae bacterium]|nr:cyclic nucleotide-binding domain-containing protein [Paracoccaceae bacterium]